MRRIATIAGIAVAVIIIGIATALIQAKLESGTKISAGDSGRQTQDAGLRPLPGTYTYTGSGTESVSALGGSKHTYPAKIDVTVTLGKGCNWTLTFLFLKEHVTKLKMCTDASGVHLLSSTDSVTFFSIKEVTETRCTDATVLNPAADPGTRWKFTCTGDGRTEAHTTRFAGLRNGVAEIIRTTQLSGKTRGSSTTHEWLFASGLPQKFAATTSVESDEIIRTTQYSSRDEYTLTSATPR